MDGWILNFLKMYNERTVKSPAHIMFAFQFSLTNVIMVCETAVAAAAHILQGLKAKWRETVELSSIFMCSPKNTSPRFKIMMAM
jgi:hypothetical protein